MKGGETELACLSYMEDEIDLRKYLNVLIRQWKWVVGLALVAALAALAVSLLLPPRYEATALFVVTRPRYQLQFDPMIPSLPVQSQSYRALPELALSDDLVMQVIDVLGGQLQANERSLVSFRSRLSAEAGADPSLIRLSATATDPQKAQTIANTWATLYITYTNNLYQQGAADARFFQTQAAEARAKLESSEQALIDYQARNPVNVINAPLAANKTAFSDFLRAGQGVTLIIQDARSLQQQLGQQNANEPSSLADELSALYLQVDALNSKASVPIQLQIGSGGSLANRTVAEQVALLGTLVKTLQDKKGEN